MVQSSTRPKEKEEDHARTKAKTREVKEVSNKRTVKDNPEGTIRSKVNQNKTNKPRNSQNNSKIKIRIQSNSKIKHKPTNKRGLLFADQKMTFLILLTLRK